MLFARNALGSCLCQAELLPKTGYGPRDEVWEPYATAIMFLGIASQRIRAFFKAAIGKVTATASIPKSMKKSAYAYPFLIAAGADSANSDLAKVLPLAQRIQQHMEERNEIIHQIASEAARRHRSDLAASRDAYEHPSTISNPLALSLRNSRLCPTMPILRRSGWKPKSSFSSSGMKI